MVADLSGQTRRDLAPPGLRIARVESEPELRAFARVLAANWTPPDPQVIRFYELAASALLWDSAPLWLYVGYLGEVPVATADLTLGGGLAGLYNISTLAAHRGGVSDPPWRCGRCWMPVSEATGRRSFKLYGRECTCMKDWASGRSVRSRSTSQ
jgi:hypothetical protein